MHKIAKKRNYDVMKYVPICFQNLILLKTKQTRGEGGGGILLYLKKEEENLIKEIRVSNFLCSICVVNVRI